MALGPSVGVRLVLLLRSWSQAGALLRESLVHGAHQKSSSLVWLISILSLGRPLGEVVDTVASVNVFICSAVCKECCGRVSCLGGHNWEEAAGQL